MNLSNPLVFAAMCALCIVVGILIHKYVPGASATAVEALVATAEDDLRTAAPKVVAAVAAVVPEVKTIFGEVKDAAETEALSLLSKGIAWLTDTTGEDADIADATKAIEAAKASKAHKASLLAQHQQAVAALKVA